MNRSLLCILSSMIACVSFTSHAAQSTRPNFTERRTVPLRFNPPQQQNSTPRNYVQRRHYDNCAPSRGSLFGGSRPTNNYSSNQRPGCNSGYGQSYSNQNYGPPYNQNYSNPGYGTPYSSSTYYTPPANRPTGGGYRPTTPPVYRPTTPPAYRPTTPTTPTSAPYVPTSSSSVVAPPYTPPSAPPTYTPPANRPVNGNNGLRNGVDPQPPGNPPPNDQPGTSPDNPGNGNGNGNGNNRPRRRAQMIYILKDGTEIPAVTTLESGDDYVIKTEDGKMVNLKKAQIKSARETDDEPIYATR